GGQGRDISIGGNGADRIIGDAGDDILIAGRTTFDGNFDALAAIMAEWAPNPPLASHSYNQRVYDISNGAVGTDATTLASRANGNYYLIRNSTVFNDDAVDVLTGSAGMDWFLFNDTGDLKKDKVTDL